MRHAASETNGFRNGLSVCCIGLGVLVIGLSLRIRAFEVEVAKLSEQVRGSSRVALVEGEPLPSISLFDVQGQPLEPLGGATDRGTLLFISSQSCDACKQVRPLWDEIAGAFRGAPLAMLELVLEAQPGSLVGRQELYPLAVPGTDQWSLVNKLQGVPAALLVDANGVVRRAFYGSPHTGLRQAVEQFLFR